MILKFCLNFKNTKYHKHDIYQTKNGLWCSTFPSMRCIYTYPSTYPCNSVCVCVRVCACVCAWACSVTQLCLTLCGPMDCISLDSSVHRFSRQEYWSGLPFPSSGDLPFPGIDLGLLHSTQTLYQLSYQGKSWSPIAGLIWDSVHARSELRQSCALPYWVVEVSPTCTELHRKDWKIYWFQAFKEISVQSLAGQCFPVDTSG